MCYSQAPATFRFNLLPILNICRPLPGEYRTKWRSWRLKIVRIGSTEIGDDPPLYFDDSQKINKIHLFSHWGFGAPDYAHTGDDAARGREGAPYREG